MYVRLYVRTCVCALVRVGVHVCALVCVSVCGVCVCVHIEAAALSLGSLLSET